MWSLSGFQILQKPLPPPKPGVMCGFVCPDVGCKRECKYFKKTGYDQLIGIRCSSGARGAYIVSPFLEHVENEIKKYNLSWRSDSHWNLPSTLSNLLLPPPTPTLSDTQVPIVQGTCLGFDGRTAEGHQKSRKISPKCRNALCAACCRKLAITCSYHQPPNQTLANSTPIVASQDLTGRAIASLPPRRVRPVLQCAQANRRIGKYLSQEEGDLINSSQLKLQQDQDQERLGPSTEITLRFHLLFAKWPRFSLNESEVLHEAAEESLGPRWGLKLWVCQSPSDWCMTDSSMSFNYKPTPTELLIRGVNVSLVDCNLRETPPISIHLSPPRSSLDTSDLFARQVPLDGWGSDIELIDPPIASTSSTSSHATNRRKIDVIESSDPPITSTSSHGPKKRKIEMDPTSDSESSVIIVKRGKKSKTNKTEWPGTTLKLSELLIWCSKAPKSSPRGVGVQAWVECFGDRFEQKMKTAYGYREWVELVTIKTLKRWDFNGDRTVKEGTKAFHVEFQMAKRLAKSI
ncbi:uncharacterized protein MELLADRAFT_66057 [Melampsora larici-populina 98AG31]|uniref:Uncharacterized protein n=1 Tax=Melampsora larici-populina (strain 98AG31 / pathotype 3-4-7) TaxID=747676 RepID=F4RXQ5_MELLP|nr:uncharacterized protein MELLADRAFT_66057 [Melampsora larici-populina 98AG31]EGG02857.1 hypothetical protein MELLADRAFT_66057 [Melampsora larici-populina 98AG31]